MEERNTYKGLFEVMEDDSKKCDIQLQKKDQVIETYKSDSTIYETQKLKQDTIISNKTTQISEKNKQISILKTHRSILTASTILVIILSLL